MRRIVAYLFVSVDGVAGEPTEWLTVSEDIAATVAARAESTDTVLLGRVTYEEFATEWPYRSGPMADFLNTTHKLVVSTSLEDASWQNTSLIDGNAIISEELERLRFSPGRDVLVLGSATLVQSLLRRRMIDELVLLVHPVIKGQGRRLFDELKDHVPLEPAKCVTFGSGTVSMSYAMNSRPVSGPNEETPNPAPEDTIMATEPDSAIRELDPAVRELDPAIRELDHRLSDGIDVTLLWNERTNRVSIAVQDDKTGEFFELEVNPEDALTAFYHPYAYSSRAWTDRALAV